MFWKEIIQSLFFEKSLLELKGNFNRSSKLEGDVKYVKLEP